MTSTESYTLFEGHSLLAAGSLEALAVRAKAALAADPNARLLAFDDATGRLTDLDPGHQPAPPPRKLGRPKLGVTAREVTLLPRHWEWLAAQPGGASVALRKLVEAARRDPAELRRTAREAAYRVMSALTGDLAGFEEASRTLFADDREGFLANTQTWPPDVRGHLLKMLDWS
jgi:hypothetical protein